MVVQAIRTTTQFIKVWTAEISLQQKIYKNNELVLGDLVVK